jgi:hypothetical protein
MSDGREHHVVPSRMLRLQAGAKLHNRYVLLFFVRSMEGGEQEEVTSR